jgi:acyl-CoA thioester hydrolase
VARIKLEEQPVYEFRYDLQVQVGHLNYAGHLGHDAVVRIVHEARVHLFHALGASELNLGDDRTGIIMGDLAATYSSEGYLFDELHVDSHIGEIGRSNFRIFHRLMKAGTLIALVETGLIAYDYTSRAIVPIPIAFMRALERYLENPG